MEHVASEPAALTEPDAALSSALAVIPAADLAKIILAAAVGWEQDRAGHYAIKIDKGAGRPVIVRLQPGEQVIGAARRRG